MIDYVVKAAAEWPQRCAEIGFAARETDLLSEMLKNRIDTLK
jgi:serine/threonine-protein kinase HipA